LFSQSAFPHHGPVQKPPFSWMPSDISSKDVFEVAGVPCAVTRPGGPLRCAPARRKDS
jgi:hypothetical protein